MGAYGPMFSAVKFGDAMNKGLTPNMNQCPVKRQWPRLFDHIRNGYFTQCHASNSASSTSLGYRIFSEELDDCIKPIIVADAG